MPVGVNWYFLKGFVYKLRATLIKTAEIMRMMAEMLTQLKYLSNCAYCPDDRLKSLASEYEWMHILDLYFHIILKTYS